MKKMYETQRVKYDPQLLQSNEKFKIHSETNINFKGGKMNIVLELFTF